MAFNPPKGAGKGPGNGKAKTTFGKDVNAKAASDKGNAVQARMREWRKAHPEWQPAPGAVSKKELRDYIASGMPDVIDKAFTVALDDTSSKQFEAIKMLTEQHLGRPMQAVELSGKDGEPIGVVRRVIVGPTKTS